MLHTLNQVIKIYQSLHREFVWYWHAGLEYQR